MTLARLIALALLSPVLLQAQEDRAGNALFRMPPGWHRQDVDGGTFLAPEGVPQGMLLIFLGGRPLTTSFRAGFDADLKGLSQGQRVVSAGPVQSSRTSEGVDLLSVTVELQAPNGARSSRYYLAANPTGRLEMAVYMAGTRQLYAAHWNEMLQFISSWHFAGQTASTGTAPPPQSPGPPGAAPSGPVAVPPAAADPVVIPPGRLEGIYAGYKYIYVTVLGVVQKQAAFDYYTFFADGTVYWGIVPMLGFDMARARQKDPEYSGSYAVASNRVTVSLGGDNRFVAVRSGNVLQIEDRQYTLLGDPAKTPSKSLEGVFMREDAQPGEDLARRSIRFTRDGQFEDQGIIETVLPSEIVNGEPIRERPSGRGFYQLARNTLLLRYSDGYEKRIPISIEMAQQQSSRLSKLAVNTYSLVLRP